MKTEPQEIVAGDRLSAQVDVEVCFSARAIRRRVKHIARR
jgi:hypothetical protein